MSALAAHLADYLRLRRALGFALQRPGEVLPQFVAYLEAAGATKPTTDLAIAWAHLPQGVQPIQWAHRLGAVRGFARYLQTIEPATEVPPADVFGARQRRPTPYLWSDEAIGRLLAATRQLQPPPRAATCTTVFGLLAVAGLRLGEALGLARADVDLTAGVLRIAEAKFGRARLVPLHPSATEALRAYAADRDRWCPTPRSATFFLSTAGTTPSTDAVRHAFIEVTIALGLRTATSRPRLHDLRHSFAVRTLLAGHRDGVTPDGRVAALSTYLGHIHPAGTYWYLEAAPELMVLAAARLDDHLGARS